MSTFLHVLGFLLLAYLVIGILVLIREGFRDDVTLAEVWDEFKNDPWLFVFAVWNWPFAGWFEDRM